MRPPLLRFCWPGLRQFFLDWHSVLMIDSGLAMMSRLWFSAIALLGGGTPARTSVITYQSNSPDVYIMAHQDDWQLFMGDVVAARLEANRTATFIYLTAGDDGRDSLYWRTRELAALQSTQIAGGIPATDTETGCALRTVRSHTMRECVVGNSLSVFMRLPDGNRDGRGFARYGNQSLRKLRRKSIRSITAVDGSASYAGWSDVLSTITALIDSRANDGTTTIHTSDPSVSINPHDHFDHRMAGLLVADAGLSATHPTRYYVGYALGTRAANRSAREILEKTAIFRAYDAAMTRVNSEWSAYAEHRAFYSQCMLRTYWRRAPGRRNR